MKNNEKRLPMLSWFITVLKEKGAKVDILQLTFEAVELGKDEVDLSFLPVKDFNELPPTLLFETYAYEDVDGCALQKVHLSKKSENLKKKLHLLCRNLLSN